MTDSIEHIGTTPIIITAYWLERLHDDGVWRTSSLMQPTLTQRHAVDQAHSKARAMSRHMSQPVKIRVVGAKFSAYPGPQPETGVYTTVTYPKEK